MDKLLVAFKKCEIDNNDKVLGGGIFAWLLKLGHEQGMMSECWDTDDCGTTTLNHDYENGDKDSHADGDY